jgi:hypothetical protein
VSEASINGDNDFFYTGVYHELGSFISSANGGQHNVRYTWNPSSAYYSGIVQAAGNAYASLSVSLVLTPDATNDIVAYGTSDYASAYGQMYEEGMGGSYGGFRSYYAQQNTDLLVDPKTYTVSATLTASTRYRVKLLVSYTLSVDDTSGAPYYEGSSAEVVYEENGDTGRLVVEAVSAGTIVNGGGFQTAAGAGRYLKHATNPDTIGIYTYVEGGFSTDKHYHKDTGTSLGYNVGGYPMVKGYARWASNVSQTGAPSIPTLQSLGGVVTSLASAGSQGAYNLNFALTTSDGASLSTITPSVFFTGTRDISNAVECTFTFGKFAGNSTYINFRTQDNNTDGLFNMDEIGVIVVM